VVNTTKAPITVKYIAVATTSGGAACPGSDFTYSITVNPTPDVMATPNADTICSNTATSIVLTSLVSGTTFSWTVSANAAITGASNAAGNTIAQTLTNSSNAIQTITYTITPSFSNNNIACAGNPISVIITINPTPTVINSPLSQALCSATATQLVTLNSGVAGTSYTWTATGTIGISGFSTSGTSTLPIEILVNSTSADGTVTYRITPTANGCSGPVANYITTVRPVAKITNMPLVQTICSGAATTLVTITSDVTGAVFSWTATGTPGLNGFLTSGTSSIPVQNISNSTSAVGTVVYTIAPAYNGCPGDTAKFTITVNPSPTVQFSELNQTICSNTTTKTVDLNTATTGATINWTCTIPSGITGAIASGNNTIPAQTLVNTTNAPIILTYIAKATTAGTAACAGADAMYTITVNPSPTVQFSADQTICSGSQTTVVNITSATPDVVITWTSTVPSGITGALANGGTSIPTQTLINTTTAPLTVKYLIKATTTGDAICDGEIQIFSVIVNPTPDVKATPAAQTICSASTTNIALTSSVSGTTYSWSFTTSGNISGASAGSGNSIAQTLVNSSTNPQTVTYAVKPSNTSNGILCDGASFSVVITVNPKATISNNPLSQTTCTNVASDSVLFTSNSAGASYSWTMTNAGGITRFIPDGTGNLPSMQLVNAGNTQATIVYAVSTTVDLCPGAPVDYKILVNPDAKANFTYAQDTACWPFAISIQNTSPATPNGSYNWFADNIAIGTANNFPGYTIPAPSNTVAIKMVAISLYGCKNDSAIHRFFTKPKPAPLFTASDTVGCGPLLVNFINKTPLIDTFQYRWNFANGQTSTLQQPGSIIFKSNPTFRDTTYIVKLYAFNECDTQVFRIPILVKSKPNAIFTADKTTGCSPMTVTFTNGSIGDGMSYKWIYADGDTVATNSSAPIQHTFHVASQTTFPVKMIAFNNCGADTFTLNIVVTPNTIKLNFSIDGNTVSGCIPHTIRVVNNSVGGNLFVWDFGDGNTYNSVNNIEIFTHTYYQSGTFEVSARAINTCSDTTASRTVLVLQKPIPNYTVSYSANCIGDTISFTNITDTATAYSWSFGDGSFSNAINPKHFYATPGNYTVTLYARLLHPNGQVCLDSMIKQLLIVDHLPGSFTVTDSVGNCTPFTVSFSNQSLPSVSTTWLFGDNSTGTGNNINHTYAAVGTYIATMTAIDPGGCRYDFSKKIVAGGPNGTLSYTSNTVCGPVPVRFEATAFFTDSLRWNFGDGIVVATTNRIVYHTYLQPGVYIPSVEILAGTAASCRILLKGIDTLKVDYLNAGFNKAALGFCDSTRVSFIDSSYAFSGIQSWQWSFGDGSNASTQNSIHTYTTSNNYPLHHIITSAWGCRDTSSIILPVQVAITPVAQINLGTKGCIKETIELKANINSVDSINLIKWTVSNGSVGNGNNFNIIFNQPGTYSITLQIGTVNGCYDTTSTSITIYDIPSISASTNQRICKGQSVQLQVAGSDNYQWGPLVGLSCYTCINPIATPDVTTDYIVSTINAAGCRNADTVSIIVIQPFKMTVSPNDTICIGQSATLTVSGASNYTWSPAATLSCATCPNPIAKPVLTTLYSVVGNDNFNCFTDTAYTAVAVGLYPTVTLAGDKILSTGTLLPLSSTVTNGPIRNYNWNPATDLSCSDCPLPIATIKKDICYVVKATTFYGCAATDTICIKVFCESAQVFIPNTFTPDGDGINDILMVRATGIKQVKKFTVFNRWGEIVFEKTNFSPNIPSLGWDGKVRGVKASPDVYVYMAEVICENDLHYTYKGNVTIIN
jgi:gliding motility-associated-like protein